MTRTNHMNLLTVIIDGNKCDPANWTVDQLQDFAAFVRDPKQETAEKIFELGFVSTRIGGGEAIVFDG